MFIAVMSCWLQTSAVVFCLFWYCQARQIRGAALSKRLG